ncbi:MAG TPA: hypothetical protein VH600_19895 [Burkholderiales bacterium]|jgi:hypothetical protein
MTSRTLFGAAVLCSMLAACATSPRDQPVGPAAPEASRTYRAGPGTIESATVLSLSSAPAAAGGTASPATNATMAYRLKMADGTTQDVVQAGERFEVGDRVQMTGDGRLVRPL